MSLNIFDHPTIQRLVQGSPVPIEDLRQAIVDFWKENGASEICGNCRLFDRPEDHQGPPTGCCGQCRYLDYSRGCRKRNLLCQTHTCPELGELLRKAGLRASWRQFVEMARGLDEAWGWHLPNGALVFLSSYINGDGPYLRSTEEVQATRNHYLTSDERKLRIQKWKEKQRKEGKAK